MPTWSPDTCGCRITYTIDTSATPPRTVVQQIEQACPFHSAITDPQAHLNAVLAENQSKNRFEGAVHLNISEVRESVPVDLQDMMTLWRRTVETLKANKPLDEAKLAEGLELSAAYKKGMTYRWSFDAARNLEVDVTDWPAAARAKALAESLKPEHRGKVKIKDRNPPGGGPP